MFSFMGEMERKKTSGSPLRGIYLVTCDELLTYTKTKRASTRLALFVKSNDYGRTSKSSKRTASPDPEESNGVKSYSSYDA